MNVIYVWLIQKFSSYLKIYLIVHHGNFVKQILSFYVLEIYHRKTIVFVRARRGVWFRTSSALPGLHSSDRCLEKGVEETLESPWFICA